MKNAIKIGLTLVIMLELGLLIIFFSSSKFTGKISVPIETQQTEQRDIEIEEIIKEEPDAEIYIPEQYDKLVRSLCAVNAVPVDVFSKLIQSESRWKRRAINYNYVTIKKVKTLASTDHGIAMLNDNNFEEFSWRFNDGLPVDPYNTTMALTISCRYLAWLYARTGSWYDTICAYKSGITKVREDRVPGWVEVLSKAVVDPKISALDVVYFP